jgi:hypothetical protein
LDSWAGSHRGNLLGKTSHKYGFYNHLHSNILCDSFGRTLVTDLDAIQRGTSIKIERGEVVLGDLSTPVTPRTPDGALYIDLQPKLGLVTLATTGRVQLDAAMPVFYSYPEWVAIQGFPTGPACQDSLSSTTLSRGVVEVPVRYLLVTRSCAWFVKRKYHHIRENLLHIGERVRSNSHHTELGKSSEKSIEEYSGRFL